MWLHIRLWRRIRERPSCAGTRQWRFTPARSKGRTVKLYSTAPPCRLALPNTLGIERAFRFERPCRANFIRVRQIGLQIRPALERIARQRCGAEPVQALPDFIYDDKPNNCS